MKTSFFALIIIIIQFITAIDIRAQFKPYQYKPKTPDISILQNSLKKKELRRNNAYESLSTLKTNLSEIKSQLHNDIETQKWMEHYSDSIINLVEEEIESENYGLANELAVDLLLKLKRDPRIIGRLQTTQDYNKAVEFVRSKYQRGEINTTAYESWLLANPYKYKENYIYNGTIESNNHWYPNYQIANSLDINDLCNFIKTNASSETEYYNYANKYAKIKNGSIIQEYRGYLYLLYIAQKKYEEASLQDKEWYASQISLYEQILPKEKDNLNEFIINLVNVLTQ